MPDTTHHIGLLLGTEDDWPTAFETLVGRLGAIKGEDARRHRIEVERLTIEPFDLRDRPRHELVVDRLAYWYYHPREWLKKVALMDDVYLLNSPFTFQSMEKHAAYCAMLRLGLKVPQTVLVGEDEAELVARLQALADQLAIPGLEDVERALLSRKEHQFEREETDLVHAQRVDAVAGTE